MLIVVNSDVLYTNAFMHTQMHQNWRRFADGCKNVGAELVFPKTSLYEIELRQQELYDLEVQRITDAGKLLAKYDSTLKLRPATEQVKVTDVVSAFVAEGVKVQVELPTLDDFRDAELRAAKHLPPAPPRKSPTQTGDVEQSDEMRDLVIWSVACRLAKQGGGALLLSRDDVHSGKLGRKEAEECGLLRASDFDEALGMLGAETAAGQLAKQFLAKAWDKLKEAGVALPQDFAVRTVADPTYIRSTRAIKSAAFRFGVEVDGGKMLTSQAYISQNDSDQRLYDIQLVDTKIGKNILKGGDVQATFEGPIEAKTNDDYNERLQALRGIV